MIHISVFAFVLSIIFLVVVAPTWIILHYLTRWRRSRRLSAEDERVLGELYEAATKMEARIATLERVLDAEAPGGTRRGG
ncbi:MAG TPA: envelope stress response membrane protein PspB [Stellaceae bacterium]|nr:envelope stress response membrane protein PspB [Stellaceae bacterium]